jgi:hypothetical protein
MKDSRINLRSLLELDQEAGITQLDESNAPEANRIIDVLLVC